MEQLSAAAIAAALTTRRLGRPVLYYLQIGSTNDEARARGAAGAAEGLLVLADEQVAGRGRLGRSWWAPPGSSLLMSLLLRPPLPPERLAQVGMCLGLGAAEGIAAVTGLAPALKWPNDILLDGRKLAGMLTDVSLAEGRIEFAVLGLGLNVNLDLAATSGGAIAGHEGPPARPARAPSRVPTEGVPPDVAAGAASLSAALGHPVDRLALLVAILAGTERWYDALLAGHAPNAAWAARLDTLNRPVVVTLTGGRRLEGTAVGVTPEGALLVRDAATGAVQTIWAGDVTRVR